MFGQIVQIIDAAFKARGFDHVSIVGGVETRNEQDNFGDGGSWRVAFIPPQENGEIGAPVYIGEGDPDENGEAKRQLLTMHYPLDVCCAARDEDQPDNSLANEHRCFDLYEIVVQEITRAYGANGGNYEWKSFGFDRKRKLGRFGAELVARIVFKIPIFDTSSVVKTPAGRPGNKLLAQSLEETP